MSRWNGSRRDFIAIVEANGYRCVRTNGSHSIFRNETGRIIPVNRNLNRMVVQRLIKEYGLEGV